MAQRNAEKDVERGGEFPSPPNEYWTVKIDFYGWFRYLYQFPILRMETVPSRRDNKGITGVFVFERTPKLEEAVREFWNPTTSENKRFKDFLEMLKDGRHMKLAVEK